VSRRDIMEKLIKAVFSCLIIAGFIGCGGGKVSPPELKGKNTAVTITLGGLKASSSSDRTIGRAAIPAVVDHVVFTISAPDITNIVKSVTAAGKTVISESFDVPNGSTRQFFVQAFNISGTVIYEGETSSDLDGTPITLAINLRTVVPWAKSYGSTSSDRGTAIQQTADGGFVVAGTTYSLGSPYSDVWVVKLNNSGVIEWEKTYGGAGDDGADAIQQTADGGYIVSGYTDSFGAGALDFWILKLDSTGGIEWEKTFGGANNERAFSVQQADDSGYIIAGSTLSFGTGSDIWVIKLNNSGAIEWQKTYGTANAESGSSVRQTSDGGYLVAGKTTPPLANASDFLVIKLSSNGTVEWSKTFGTLNAEEADSIRPTSDGGYIVSGRVNVGAGNSDAWVLKIAGDDTIEWQKTFGGSLGDGALSVRQTSDGEFIFAGYTYSFGSGGGDVWVIKMDSSGTVVWQNAYGTVNQEEGADINETGDGEFIVTGYTRQPNLPIDMWILNIGGDGSIDFRPSSGATVTDTGSSATITDTSVSPAVVTLNTGDTTVTGINTNATVSNTNATVSTQAP
jgi:hypothetical protein